MEKQNYFNAVTAQVKDLSALANIQPALCFNMEKLRAVLEQDACKKIKRVILTGCGDSFSAAGAMLTGFKKLSGLRKCNTPDIMDFCRFYTKEKIHRGYAAEEVLVIGISFSGSAERVAEALNKANDLGIASVLITRNPDSKGGQAAQHVLNVETPEGCNTPGLRSYYASMVGIAAFGAYIGVCNGTLTQAEFEKTKEEIAGYTAAFMQDFERIDDMMFAQALRMKDLTKFEVIADWNEGYSAQFVEEKFIECSGVYCDHTTSEEFAHISFMFRCPQEFGTVVLINEADTSLSRMKDTINGCLAQHRPTVIVSDASPATFDMPAGAGENVGKLTFGTEPGVNAMATADKPVVCQIAKAPAQWMSPFVDFIPGSLLAGYHAAANERPFFAGRYNFRTQTWNMG